jgi:zinc protease
MSKKFFAFLILSLFVLIFYQNNSQTLPKDMNEKLPVDSKVKIGKLANGLTYYIRMNNKPENNAHFRIVLRAGSIYEDDDQCGLAHFTEHMCFNGTKHYPKNALLDFLQKSGVRFGADINASTGPEQTMYELPIPLKDEKFTSDALQILEDWAHNVTFDPDMIDSERGVIISEFIQRNNAQFRLSEKHRPIIYKNSKFAFRNNIGDTTFLRTFSYDKITRFYKDWYRPDLMAVIAIGDFDVEKIESLIKEYFSKLEMPANPRKRDVVPIPYHKETLVSVGKDKEMPTETAMFYFMQDKFDVSTFAGYRETMLRELFNSMLRDRLSEAAKQTPPPFINAMSNEGDFLGDRRIFMLNTSAKPGTIKKAIDAALTEAYRVVEHGFTQGELDRAGQSFISRMESAYNERTTIAHRNYVQEYTGNFTHNEPIPGIEYEFQLSKDLISTIKLDEFKKLAARLIHKDNLVITVNLPDRESSSNITDKDILSLLDEVSARKIEEYKDILANKPLFDKKVTPGKITKEEKDEQLDITTLTLSNGAKVILKSTDFQKDQIMLHAFSPGGSSLASDNDFPSAENAVNLISEMGVSEYNTTTIKKLLAGKNVRVSPICPEQYEGFVGSSTKKDVETLMQLVHLYFKYPRKDVKDFNNYIQRMKPLIENKGNQAESVFRDSLQVTLYDHHKREMPFTLETLEKIDLNKLYTFYQDRFADASDFTFIIIGDFNIDSTKLFIEKYIASLPSTNRIEKWKDVGTHYPNKHVVNRFSKGKENRSRVGFAITGDFEWTRENRYLLRSLSDFLQIKINEEIREKRSDVYSPRVNVTYDRYPNSSYCINIDYVCDKAVIEDIIKATKELLEKVKKDIDAVGAEKVAKAQLNQYDINIKKNEAWMSNIESSLINGDDPHYFLKYKELVNNLKAEDLKNAASKYINMDHLVEVIMEPEK